ncbi:MAG: type II toxin-antitoxin system HicA family toxin [Candidatus Vogelbacteria bacterium]
MPKLPGITFKKVLAILESHSFEVDHTTGSHYILYNKDNQKRVTLPFHSGDLPKGTLLSIIKSAGLSKQDFI